MSLHFLSLVAPNGQPIRLVMLPTGEWIERPDVGSTRTLPLRLEPLRQSLAAATGPVMVDRAGGHWTWPRREGDPMAAPSVAEAARTPGVDLLAKDGTDGP